MISYFYVKTITNNKKKLFDNSNKCYSISLASSSINESSDFEYLHPKHRILT